MEKTCLEKRGRRLIPTLLLTEATDGKDLPGKERKETHPRSAAY